MNQPANNEVTVSVEQVPDGWLCFVTDGIYKQASHFKEKPTREDVADAVHVGTGMIQRVRNTWLNS